jgi:hypothetical protein
MRKNVAAALLSGLVFPGAGQWWLGRRLRGLLFLAGAAAGGYAYLSYSLDTAWALADQVLAGKIDPAAVAAQAEAQATPFWVSAAGLVFVLCWAGSVIDAWLTRQT